MAEVQVLVRRIADKPLGARDGKGMCRKVLSERPVFGRSLDEDSGAGAGGGCLGSNGCESSLLCSLAEGTTLVVLARRGFILNGLTKVVVNVSPCTAALPLSPAYRPATEGSSPELLLADPLEGDGLVGARRIACCISPGCLR